MSTQSNSPVSTMSTMLLTVKQDLWCAMSVVKNIHATKVFNTFFDHTIDMVGVKKMQKQSKRIRKLATYYKNYKKDDQFCQINANDQRQTDGNKGEESLAVNP